jgi:fluoride ion exporter CrcB/FEX
MLNYIWVSTGSAIGSAARFWISALVAQCYDQSQLPCENNPNAE